MPTNYRIFASLNTFISLSSISDKTVIGIKEEFVNISEKNKGGNYDANIYKALNVLEIINLCTKN